MRKNSRSGGCNVRSGSKKTTGTRHRQKVLLPLTILAGAVTATMLSRTSFAAQFIYTPDNATTDVWGTPSTGWSALPVSATTTELTFVSPNTTLLANSLLNTNTDNLSGLFSLNILDLQGTGPASGAAVININSSSPATGLNMSGTSPVINLNALAGTAGLTYNVNAPVNFAVSTNITGNGTATFNLFGNTTAAASTTVQKTGTSVLTIAPASGFDSFVTLQANGGTLNLAGGTINTSNLQMAPASGVAAVMTITGGTITNTIDFRMQASGTGGSTALNMSGGVMNLSKVIIGSAGNAIATANVLTLSGSAIVNQNQTGSTRELWVGGNNGGSGELLLENNSSWTAGSVSSADAVIGRFSGNGVLTIQDNATFTYAGTTLDVGDTLGSGTSTSGTINLNGGTLAVLGVIQGAGNGTANVSTANFNANGGVVQALGASSSFFNGFVPAASSIKTGSITLLAGGLTFNTNGFADTITNALPGSGGITKQGAGILTLTGPSTYTGNTSVTAGTLLVNGAQTAASGTPSISISTGAILGGTGTIAGTLNHTAGTITGGTVGTIGTLTFSGPVTLNGGTMLYDVNGANVLSTGNNSTAGDQIQVNNNLTFGSTPEVINFAFNSSASLPSSFTYKIFGYTGTLGGTPNLTYTSNLGRTQFTTVTGTAGEVDVTVNPLAATLNWNSTSSGAWDVQTTSNWFNTGTNAADQFFNGDSVNFVDNNANSTPPNGQLQTVISLGISVSPGSVTDSANSNSYTISGAGNINGSATVSVTGTAPFIIQTNNNYSGGTTINAGGTIQLGNGTTGVGTLGSGTVTDNGSLITNYGATATLANVISGTGSLTLNGSATVSVTASNTYSGATIVNAGTLELDGTGSLLGTGTITDTTAIVSTGTNVLAGNLSGGGTITTTGTSVLKLTGSNTAFTGTTNVNAGTTLQIGNGGTAGTLPGGTLNLLGNLSFDRSNTLTLSNPLNVTTTVSQIGPAGSNLILTGSNTIANLNVGDNIAAGSLTVPGGASLSVGNNGTGALNVGVSPNQAGAVVATGTLDASQASSFNANVATISVGTTGNQSVTAFGNLYLPANSNITATTSFLVGDSAGAQNGNTLQPPPLNGSSSLTIGSGGTTNISTPVFSIGQTKSSATFVLGSGETLNVSGIGAGGRSLMSVGNILTGGGSGIYDDTVDLSAGTVNLVLSGLDVGVNGNNTGTGSAEIVATMHIGSSPANHLDISGPSVGGTGDAGVVNIGCEITNSTNPQTGTLTIDNLNSTSSIVSTNNGTAILIGGALSAGNSMGTLNLNGGTLMITTTGSAIASDTNAVPGFTTSGTSTVNFNGITLVAGASSTTWIQNLTLADGVTSGANLLAGGLTINTNGFNITVPQQFVSSGSDGGITKLGTGTLTLTAGIAVNTSSGAVANPASTYNGPTSVRNGTLLIPAGAANPSGSTVIVGSSTIGAIPILAGTGIIGGPAVVWGTGNASSGHVAAGMTGATLGTLSFGNGLTFNPGSNADFRLGVAAGSTTSTPGFSSLIAVTGGVLTLPTGSSGSNPGSVVINLTDDANAGGQGSIGSGTYELFSFGSLTNTFDPSEFTIGSSPLASASTYTFSEVSGNQIDLTISAVTGPQNLVWSGGSPAWDVASTPNWNANSSKFNQGDNVTFDNTNTGSLTVTTGSTTVLPGSITVNSSKAYVFNGTGGIGGSTGLTESGGGSLTIQNTNTFTGATNISGGGTALSLTSAGTLATSSLTVGAGSIATITGLLTGTPALTVNGTVTFGANAMDGTNGNAGTLLVRNLGALNVAGTLNIAAAPAASHSSRTLVTATSLTLTGVIDLSNNDMIIRNASAGSITSQLAAGYGGGAWNGSTGIISSSAAADSTHLTAIGYIPGGSTFDGVSTASADVLLKYTYYGDATLDGKVDGSDYSRIDFGYLTGATGWYNGDFNYDGLINGSDYTLIDNACNTQGASLATQTAGPTAEISSTGSSTSVPEPASLSLLGFTALGMLSRRRRR